MTKESYTNKTIKAFYCSAVECLKIYPDIFLQNRLAEEKYINCNNYAASICQTLLKNFYSTIKCFHKPQTK